MGRAFPAHRQVPNPRPHRSLVVLWHHVAEEGTEAGRRTTLGTRGEHGKAAIS